MASRVFSPYLSYLPPTSVGCRWGCSETLAEDSSATRPVPSAVFSSQCDRGRPPRCPHRLPLSHVCQVSPQRLAMWMVLLLWLEAAVVVSVLWSSAVVQQQRAEAEERSRTVQRGNTRG